VRVAVGEVAVVARAWSPHGARAYLLSRVQIKKTIDRKHTTAVAAANRFTNEEEASQCGL